MSPSPSAVPWHLVGRDQQLAVGEQAVVNHSGIMVLGDAGVGKTGFLAALTSRLIANQLGDSSATGELPRVIKLRASPALATVALGALAPVLPPQSGIAGSDADMAERAQQLLTRQFRDRGALLVMDDAHHLDPLSVRVIHALASSPASHGTGADSSWRLKWLLAGRARHHFPVELVELWAADHLKLIKLEPLKSDDVRQLVDRHLGSQTNTNHHRIMDATAGNPLLLHELIEGARSMNQLVQVDQSWTIADHGWTNPQVAVTVRSHLGELTNAERDIVEFLAIALDTPPDLLLSTFEESDIAGLERRGLLVERESGLGLRYGIHTQVLATEISARRRQALLQRVVAANLSLFAETGSGHDRLRLAVASWDLQAGHSLDPSDYLSSVQPAITNNEVALARTFLEHVRQVGALDPFEFLLNDAQVQAAEGNVAQAMELLGSLLGTGGTVPELHAAASALGTMIREFQVAPVTALAMIEDARFLIDAPGVQARLRITQAQALVLNGLLRRASALVTNVEDADSAAIDSDTGSGIGGELSVHDELGLQVVRAVTQANGGLWAHARVHARRLQDLDGGRSVTVTHTARACDALAVAFGSPQGPDQVAAMASWASGSGEQSALVFTALGRFVAGKRESAAQLARTAQQQLDIFDPLELAPLARALGDWSNERGADDPLGKADAVDATTGIGTAWRWVQLLRSWHHVEHRREAGASFDPDSLVQVAERSFTDGWFAIGLTAVHQLARYGAASAAVGLLLPAMRELDRSAAQSGVTPAIVAYTLGAAQQDPLRLLESAAAFWAFGWTSVAAASYLHAAHYFDGTGEHHSSLMASLTGLEAATRSGDPTPLLASGVNPLVTGREFEVVKAIASGKSSKQAAQALFVSPRTIDNQVFRLCKRFDLSGRSDLVAAVAYAREQVA